MSQGVKRIAVERERQIKGEGWTSKHDDEHEDCSLALAAVCYAAPEQVYVRRDYAVGMELRDPSLLSIVRCSAGHAEHQRGV
jgi:hypothetical protein